MFLTTFVNPMLAGQIKGKRNSLGLSLQDLSDRTLLDPSLLSRYENGNRLPTREHVLRLSRALALDEEDLLVLWMKEKLQKVLDEEPGETIRHKALYALRPKDSEPEENGKQQERKLESRLMDWRGRWNKLAELYPVEQASVYQEAVFTWCGYFGSLSGLEWQEEDYRKVLEQGMTLPGVPLKEHLKAWSVFQVICGMLEETETQKPDTVGDKLGLSWEGILPPFQPLRSLKKCGEQLQALNPVFPKDREQQTAKLCYLLMGLLLARFPLIAHPNLMQTDFRDPGEFGEILLAGLRRMVESIEER